METEQLSNASAIRRKIHTNNEEAHDIIDDDEHEAAIITSNNKNDKTRKISHSEIERRRREKLNRYIDEIAQLLPMDAAKKLDKLTVLRVAVDTIKHAKGSLSSVSLNGFEDQMYLNDTELLELILAVINQMGTYFFLIIECQKGRICYASNSTETILGYKPTDLCSQSIFDITYPNDADVIKQQLICEKKMSSTYSEIKISESTVNSLCSSSPNYFDIGTRRKFSCRIKSKKKRLSKITDDYLTIDFTGYIKSYGSTSNNQNEIQSRTNSSYTTVNVLTSFDVLNSIGTNPVTCLLTMGNLAKRLKICDNISVQANLIDRMFLCKLNPDGRFTYVDQICYSLLGYLSQDLVGKNLKDFVHTDDRNKLVEIWNKIEANGQMLTVADYRFRTKDDIYLIFETIFQPFVNPWTDELEIIVARNRIKFLPSESSTLNSHKKSSSNIINMDPLSSIDTIDFIHQYLP